MELLKNISSYLEDLAPPSYQESYDNSGLITGNHLMQITNALVTLDCIEETIDEAIVKNCNLIIAHHPIVFSGLKKINGKNYVERTIIKAIKNDIAIYAIHTNLDNVSIGVNSKICEKLGLINCRILSPKSNTLRKLVTFIPLSHANVVRQSLFDAGAGRIGNYDECSFNMEGTGTFRGNNDANPHVGEKNKQHHENEIRIEVIYETIHEQKILAALRKSHPYEEIAHDIYSLANNYQGIGSGMIGELESEMDEKDFLVMLKSQMKTQCIRHTKLLNKKIKCVAVCGGAGSFLLNDAKTQGANIFITSDYKYHQFFDAEDQLIIADIGHYESEQFTSELIAGLLKRKFSTFAVHLTECSTNPVNYF